ncbi:MAG: PA14 domain-containing protein [Candidatus Brocadia sinica]|nr:PA14 domain-containing protein [Candidatus Brocadia sinica]
MSDLPIYEKVKLFLRKGYLHYPFGLLAALLSWGTYFIYLWPRMLFWTRDGLTSGWIGIWADWSAHFSYASAFAYRPVTDWFTVHPLYYARKFTYPFVADMISGLLIRLGVDQVPAFIIPSIITTIFLLIALYLLYSFILKSGWQALTALTLFFAGGGMGFYWFVQDFSKKPSWKTILFPPKEYTHIGENCIEWINVFSGQLVPQRALLLGMPIMLVMLTILLKWMQRHFRDVPNVWLVLLGVFSSFMLVIHIHSYIAFTIFCMVFFVCTLRSWKQWILFAFSAAVPSILIYRWFYGGEITSSFFSWYPGWLANARSKNVNYFYFWWLNWGLFLPFSLWAIWQTKYYKHPFIIGGLAIFLLSNLILFQPYAWDNSKVLSWSYLVLCIPAASYLAELWRKNIALKGVVVLLFISMTASGFLDLWRLTRTGKLSNIMWSNADLALAKEFRGISRATDRVLTADTHNHWVSTQAGRQILLGYKGWMWTYGIDYGQTARDMMTIFSGGDNTEHLLNKYAINYVVIGPAERHDYHANEKYFKSRYKKILENKEYRIYEVNHMDSKQILVQGTQGQDLADQRYGLRVCYYGNINWEGEPITEDIDTDIEFHWNTDGEKPISSPFSAIWKGYVDITIPGVYTFKLTSDDGSWLYIDDMLVIDNGGIYAIKSMTGAVTLEKGKHKIMIKYFDGGGGAVFKLSWIPPGGGEEKIHEERLKVKE